MPTHINPLRLRKVLGRDEWEVPQPFGPDGWSLLGRDGESSVIASSAYYDGAEWAHASMTRPDRVPDYDDMCRLHRAVWGERGYAYQVHAPTAQHVNIHEYALHLWGRLDGAPVLPEFGMAGTI